MSDRLLKESDVIEAFKGRESLIHDVYTATAIIRSVPSADRPQGEWMPFSTAEWISPVADFYKCSICGKRVNLFQMRNYNYCPHCGARMEGADDESTL